MLLLLPPAAAALQTCTRHGEDWWQVGALHAAAALYAGVKRGTRQLSIFILSDCLPLLCSGSWLVDLLAAVAVLASHACEQ